MASLGLITGVLGSDGIFGGIDQDGERTESFPESDKDLWRMREADVLPH